MDIAKSHHIDEIFIFDQDTVPSDLYFEQMTAFKEEIDKKNNRIAFCVPNFYDRHCETFAQFPAIKPFSIRHYTCNDLKDKSVDSHLIAITSGMLISLSKYSEIGPFRNDYFIDFIDNEYCLRAASKGYRVEINCDALIDHSIGHRIKSVFFGLEIKPNNHPPVRRYYIARNGIKTAINYRRKYPSYILLMTVRLSHELLSIFLFEKNRLQKIKAVVIGALHAIIGKMGECNVPFNKVNRKITSI
jgi:rhamnosyltransferase